MDKTYNNKIGLFWGQFSGGGAEKVMINLAKVFNKVGFEVVIYVVNDEGPNKSEVPVNIKVKNLNARAGVKSVIHKVRGLLTSEELDILIATQPHIVAAVAIAKLTSTNSPKIIFRQESIASKNVKSAFKKYLYSFSFKQADAVIGVSKGVKEDLVRFYGINPEDVYVIYNPVFNKREFMKKVSSSPEHSWFREDGTTIVGMGRLKPVKDFLTLIKAFNVVHNKIDNSKLIIFGSKNDESHYRFLKGKINDMGLKENINLAGYTHNPYSHLKNADLFVLSSKTEGFGNVLVEAMACGCPIVSTDCPSGPREILQDEEYGYLVEVGDYREMAKKMLTAIKDSTDRKKLKKRASIFNTENIVGDYTALFGKLLS